MADAHEHGSCLRREVAPHVSRARSAAAACPLGSSLDAMTQTQTRCHLVTNARCRHAHRRKNTAPPSIEVETSLSAVPSAGSSTAAAPRPEPPLQIEQESDEEKKLSPPSVSPLGTKQARLAQRLPMRGSNSFRA